MSEPEPELQAGDDAGLDQRPPVLRQEKPPTASEEEEWEAQVYADDGEPPGLERITEDWLTRM